jgi:hypothetical protein
VPDYQAIISSTCRQVHSRVVKQLLANFNTSEDSMVMQAVSRIPFHIH